MTRAVRLIGIAWLIVAASYLRWAVAIGRMIFSRTQFTVDAWTLATPFVILVLAPVGAFLAWRKKDLLGRMLLIVVSINWLLWAVLGADVFRDFLWVPRLLKMILILSLSTLTVVALEYRAAQQVDAWSMRRSGRRTTR